MQTWPRRHLDICVAIPRVQIVPRRNLANHVRKSNMNRLFAASSRKQGESGLTANDHALFYKDAQGVSHVFYRTFERGWLHPKHKHFGNGTPEQHPRIKDYGIAVPTAFVPGEFLPRIWRGLEHPPSAAVGLHDAEVSTRRVVGDLCSRLQNVFWHAEPDPVCRDVFSHELRSLLILACTEVESSWKAVLEAHKYPGSNWSTKDYIRLKEPMRLTEWTLVLEQHPKWGRITPFATWTAEDGRTTASLPWYKAYNETKHDREKSLSAATLQHVIDAIAAAHVMMIAQFGWSISVEDVLRVPLEKQPDIFAMVDVPSWTADQEYVAPIDDFSDAAIGYTSWTPKLLQF